MKTPSNLGFDALPEAERVQIRATLGMLNEGRMDLLSESSKIELELRYEMTPAEYERPALDAWRKKFATLARTGRLPLATLDQLTTEFEAAAVVSSSVTILKGRPAFATVFKFRTPAASYAFALLRLAEVSTPTRRALLCCKECGALKAIEKTRGRRQENFCSDAHRNRFNQRQFQVRAAKHK